MGLFSLFCFFFFVVVCFLDIDECEEGEGRTSCGEKTCVNVPGSFRCEPKETEKIKPVFQGESMEFYLYSKSCLVTEQKGVIFVVFFPNIMQVLF